MKNGYLYVVVTCVNMHLCPLIFKGLCPSPTALEPSLKNGGFFYLYTFSFYIDCFFVLPGGFVSSWQYLFFLPRRRQDRKDH